MRVVVVVGPGLPADTALLTSLTATTCAELGVTGRLVSADSAARVRSLFAEADEAVVVLPGPTAEVRALAAAAPQRVLWCDLTVEPPLPGVAHVAGRGVWGLVWAIRHAVHRLRRPARRIAYGAETEQWGELRLPPAPTGTTPVVALLHGGYWRSNWGADLMDALAIDLADNGYATWNLEYRRPDRHGWDATVADVSAGVLAVAGFAATEPVDASRVVLVGHSAGGQLALRAAADLRSGVGGTAAAAASPVRVGLAVSLAGVLDLTEGYRRFLGEGAIRTALGGAPEEVPGRYAASDPAARVPIGVPTLLVQGEGDGLDLIDVNRRYAAAARAAGDEVIHLEQPGDHFDVITPGSPIWQATRRELDRWSGRTG